jgi:LmbE family N-acetylglucosaminyl deacetylase
MHGLAMMACWSGLAMAQAPVELPGADERFKADLLLVVAHVDDDTIASPYLARAVLDEGKRVAVVHVTNTASGFHAFAAERQRALGLIRQFEARQALGLFGISQVWFLEGDDTFSQNVLASLHSLGHGRTLEQVVRVMRLTRPEVVLTWLPVNGIGQNHGGHQAAGVLATEAFDLSGDSTAFPAQLDRDGLRPWQPKKLYFASDAFSTEFMRSRGPAYSMYDVSPSRKKTYIELAVEETAVYRSQYMNDDWKEAFASADMMRILRVLTTGDWPYFVDPMRFVLGKSLVGGMASGDIFEAVAPAPIGAVAATHGPPAAEPVFGLGPPWSFYAAFYERHGLRHISRSSCLRRRRPNWAGRCRCRCSSGTRTISRACSRWSQWCRCRLDGGRKQGQSAIRCRPAQQRRFACGFGRRTSPRRRQCMSRSRPSETGRALAASRCAWRRRGSPPTPERSLLEYPGLVEGVDSRHPASDALGHSGGADQHIAERCGESADARRSDGGSCPMASQRFGARAVGRACCARFHAEAGAFVHHARRRSSSCGPSGYKRRSSHR